MAFRLTNWREYLKERDCYSISNAEMAHCSACSISFKMPKNARKFCFDSHENSFKHQENIKRWKSSRLKQVPTLDQLADYKSNKFSADLTKMLVSSNTPIEKVNNPPFKKFIDTWCGESCPDPSGLRRSYLAPVYVE